IIVIAIHHRAAETILAGQRILPDFDIEQAAEVASVHRLGVELVAKAEIQGEPSRDLPIVLYEAAEIQTTLASPVEHGRPLREAGVTQQKIGERQPRAGRIGARSETRAIDLLPEKRCAFHRVEPLAANVHSELPGVFSA